jgi:ABC-type proline/glycine betaine transport system ATPase subunit
MLDDVFSGLDAISEDRIFSRLLGKSGLLRRLGATVILVTHAAHRLSYADHIVSLSAEGTVSEQGNLGQLLKSNGYVASLAARHTTETEEALKEELTKPKRDDDTARRNAAVDLDRAAGNWAVYNLYFTSIGRRRAVAWLGLMVCYAMFLGFPGKTIPVQVKSLLK